MLEIGMSTISQYLCQVLNFLKSCFLSLWFVEVKIGELERQQCHLLNKMTVSFPHYLLLLRELFDSAKTITSNHSVLIYKSVSGAIFKFSIQSECTASKPALKNSK